MCPGAGGREWPGSVQWAEAGAGDDTHITLRPWGGDFQESLVGAKCHLDRCSIGRKWLNECQQDLELTSYAWLAPEIVNLGQQTRKVIKAGGQMKKLLDKVAGELERILTLNWPICRRIERLLRLHELPYHNHPKSDEFSKIGYRPQYWLYSRTVLEICPASHR